VVTFKKQLHRKRNVSSNLRERKILVEILDKMGGFELREWLILKNSCIERGNVSSNLREKKILGEIL